jgi:hypothetical protein
MRQFNLKGEWLIPRQRERPSGAHDSSGADAHGGAGVGAAQLDATGGGMRREDHVTDEEERAVREWLAHVEAASAAGVRRAERA